MSGIDIGIDLGTANVFVYASGKGIVLQEPSVVAIEKRTNEILAVGEEARRMIGRTPGNIVAIRPLKDGVISNYSATEKMLKYFIAKISEGKGIGKLVMPRIMVSVPPGITEVEKNAVEGATREAGARDVYVIEEPIAAAIGAGLDIGEANGHMIIDIGGGTTDIAVISLGGIVVSESIKIGGDKFDEAIIRYIKKQRNVLIGERTAEELKMTIGCAVPREDDISIKITGRNLITGLPTTIEVTSLEILDALKESIEQILVATRTVLEKTPPELASDISETGIVMTGGGALLYGIGESIKMSTGIDVCIAEEPLSCVAKGTGIALTELDILETGGSIKR